MTRDLVTLRWQVRDRNFRHMADPSRCDAPWCGEPLESHRVTDRRHGAVTCDTACRKRLSRWNCDMVT